ncbi:MAG TPA: hypothetical protein DGB72_12925 [Gemmatimonadetes bacterium]|jgi:hypothetical protein|nr:hypothetical protein [Gemmatimonadota bacterium]
MNSASSESHEPVVAGERLAGARRVDGNAAAGILSEVFVPDLTAARAKCARCGVTRTIGTLMVYAHGMGPAPRQSLSPVMQAEVDHHA